MALLGLMPQEPLSSLREYRSGLSRRSTSLGAVRGVHAERESRDALVPRAESPLARRPFEAERQRARSLAGAREVPSRSMAGRDREAQMISEPRVREASFLSEPSPHIDRRMEKFEVESRPNRRSLDLETRAQQRQRNWGTLRSSWLVKNCFSSWRSFVAHQVAAARTQRQQELQISTLYELQTSLAKKEEEIKRLLLEMERNEQAFLKQEELLQAELRLLRQRLRAAHEDVAALQYRADQALLMARTFDLWHRAVLSNPKEILLLQQRIEELEEALKDAEHQRRRSENEWRLKLKRAQEEMEALQRELQEELERRQRRIEELEEALSDAEQQMRRSENEWRLKLKRAQEEMDALRRRLEEEWSAKLDAARGEWGLELDNSKNVFELQLEKVHKQHEAQKKLQEEEDAVKNRKLQLQMEELRRKQLEAKQNAQMRTMSALMGKGAKGALSLAFVAWVRYLAHAKQEKKDKELELALDKKDQELQKLLKDQQALNRSLKDRQKEFDLHCRNSREEATARAHHLLGGDGLSYREALWLSQVLSAWLLVATALHWARARELYAGQADQLRLQLEELRREKHLAMRDKLLFSRELRENQALVSRVLHKWLRLRYHGTLEAHGERADQLAKNLRARQELLLERACLGFGMKNARQLLRSCFKAWHARIEALRMVHGCKRGFQGRMEALAAKMLARYLEATPHAVFLAWSRATRQMRYERAAQQMLSKVDFLKRSKLSNRDALLSRSQDAQLRALARKILAFWWQEAKASRHEKTRQQWNRAMGRLGDRGANCGSRLAAKFWSMKMRLLLFASFMAWRFRLARESSAQLRKALAETEAAHFAFASRGLMLSDAFRRWRRWAADLSFQRSVSALLSRTTGPGRVLAVVSSIEEKRRRLLCMEAFLRWTTVLRWKSSSPKAAQTAQVIHPAWTVAAAAPPVTMRVSSAPQAVRAASCPSCGNVYLPDSIFCRRCGRKRDLVSLDIMRPSSVTLPQGATRTAAPVTVPVTAAPVTVPVTAFAPVTVTGGTASPTSVTSIRGEEVSSPRSQMSQLLASPEVRQTEMLSEPVAVTRAPVTVEAASSPLRGGASPLSPVRVVQSVTPEHSPVRFIPRLNSGWPPAKEVRLRESFPKSGSDTSLGPAVWRAAR